MFDSYLMKKIEKITMLPARFCVRINLSENYITAAGLLAVAPLFVSIVYGQWALAFCFIIFNRFADGLDGVVARLRRQQEDRSIKKSQAKKQVLRKNKIDKKGIIHKKNLTFINLFGAYFDIVADYCFYVAIPLAFAVHSPSKNALASTFLLASFVLTAVTFLAFSVQAQKMGIVNKKLKQKGFYYFSGMIEGGETILFFFIVVLFSEQYANFSYVFAALCGVTALVRTLQGQVMLNAASANRQ